MSNFYHQINNIWIFVDFRHGFCFYTEGSFILKAGSNVGNRIQGITERTAVIEGKNKVWFLGADNRSVWQHCWTGTLRCYQGNRKEASIFILFRFDDPHTYRSVLYLVFICWEYFFSGGIHIKVSDKCQESASVGFTASAHLFMVWSTSGAQGRGPGHLFLILCNCTISCCFSYEN